MTVRAFYSILANFLVTIILYSILRGWVHTPHQAFIDFAVLAVGSTAHLWYWHGASWKIKTSVAGASVVINGFAIIFYVVAVLRDSL